MRSNTFPYYVNTRGDLSGNYNDVSGTTGHGFVLTKDGAWIGFDAPGAAPNSTLAIGINDRRQILGSCRGISGQSRTFLVSLDDVLSTDGFTFIDLAEGPVTPETMNNAGVFVGIYADSKGTHGLIADPTGRGATDRLRTPFRLARPTALTAVRVRSPRRRRHAAAWMTVTCTCR